MKTKKTEVKNTETKTKHPSVKKPKIPTGELAINMSTTQLFEMYRGMFARIDDKVGVVCGYDERSLIMAVTLGKGWVKPPVSGAVIKTYLNNTKGYCYVNKTHLILTL
jgi:hypothetical protein